MAISKASLLANSYRFFRVEICGCENEKIRGYLYHDKFLGQGIRFDSLLELAKITEDFLDSIKYPMRTTNIRRFEGNGEKKDFLDIYKEKMADETTTVKSLLSFELTIRQRNFATWQGCVTWLDTEQQESFVSFLEFVEKLDCRLRKLPEPELFRSAVSERSMMYQVAVDDYQEHSVSGRIHERKTSELSEFTSSIELAKAMSRLMEKESEPEKLENKIINRSLFGFYRSKGQRADFNIQILFQKNHSWQGIIFWKNKKMKLSFRSFLEMLFILDEALEEGNEQQFAAYEKEAAELQI